MKMAHSFEFDTRRHGSVKVRLATTDVLAPMTLGDVVETPGSEFPDEIVMLGNHYDGHDTSRGAVNRPIRGGCCDGGRPRTQNTSLPCRRLPFVLWGVEEIGLLSSDVESTPSE